MLHHFYCVSFLLLVESPLGAIIVTSVAFDDNLIISSTDYSLFSGEDFTSLSNGNDVDSTRLYRQSI